MNKNNSTSTNKEELREKLAAIEHERWADWQKWMHKVLRDAHDPSPEYGDIMERWDRQIETPYSELSDKEKASDMEQVDRYWHLIEEYVAFRESALLSRVREEVIGEDEYPDEHFPTVLSGKQIERYDKVTARDRLRATQRTKLDQLSKELHENT